jgi:hypothetical protein
MPSAKLSCSNYHRHSMSIRLDLLRDMVASLKLPPRMPWAQPRLSMNVMQVLSESSSWYVIVLPHQASLLELRDQKLNDIFVAHWVGDICGLEEFVS